MQIVIIGQNEGKHAKQMFESLPCLADVIYIADRCSDDTVNICKEYGVKCVETPQDWQGRKTSSARNLGLSLCKSDSDVLFLDGDRYIMQGDLSELQNAKSDIVCLSLENDFRTAENFSQNYGRVLSGFFSCGVFFKRSAIQKIIDYRGELFPTCVEDVWGIEDTCLGDVCYHLGLSAELSEHVRLRGRFERVEVENLDVIEMRLRFREGLDVRWT